MMKRRANAGFTLSETLTTVLLLGIVFAAIGGGIVMLRNSYLAITKKSEAQVLLSTVATQVSADLHNTSDIYTVTTTSGTASTVETYYFCNNRDMAIQYVSKASGSAAAEPLRFIVYGDKEKTPYDLVTSKTNTSLVAVMVPEDGDNLIKYSDGLFTFKIKICDKNDTAQKAIEENEFTVRPYNTVMQDAVAG